MKRFLLAACLIAFAAFLACSCASIAKEARLRVYDDPAVTAYLEAK